MQEQVHSISCCQLYYNLSQSFPLEIIQYYIFYYIRERYIIFIIYNILFEWLYHKIIISKSYIILQYVILLCYIIISYILYYIYEICERENLRPVHKILHKHNIQVSRPPPSRILYCYCNGTEYWFSRVLQLTKKRQIYLNKANMSKHAFMSSFPSTRPTCQKSAQVFSRKKS